LIYSNWWKYAGAALVMYSIIGGLLFTNPNNLLFLDETVRNLNYHVPMWFAMMALLTVSVVNSIRYLRTFDSKYDTIASKSAAVAVFFGLMGLATGSVWARFSWGDWWTADHKLNGAAIGVLMYLAYLILRNSLEDPSKKARISAVYSIFAFPLFMVFAIILPKMAANSMHPGSGDTVGFNKYPLNNNLRMTFYPAVAGWVAMGWWVTTILIRNAFINQKLDDNEN
jgi:heme exporter protein C